MSEAFWNGEIENEFRIRGWTEKTFQCKASRECYMNDIDSIRLKRIFLLWKIFSFAVCEKWESL